MQVEFQFGFAQKDLHQTKFLNSKIPFETEMVKTLIIIIEWVVHKIFLVQCTKYDRVGVLGLSILLVSKNNTLGRCVINGACMLVTPPKSYP